MALFSKPPAKKPVPPRPAAKSAGSGGALRVPVSARDLAAQAVGRRGVGERPRSEPTGDITVTGASLIEWSPMRTSIEVAAANPGLCAVLENAALLYASGQSALACTHLQQGVESDPEAKISPLAWLALFDLLQRTNDKVAFDRMALQYVMQFERSAPPWEEHGRPDAAPVVAKPVAGGYVVLTGKLCAAMAPQIDGLRRTIAKNPANARLDLVSVAGFDDDGARLLADALADARKRGIPLKIQRPEKVRAALDILVKRGRAGGEGAWMLSLELLQYGQDQDAFDERAIEYAIAYEQSPPPWEPSISGDAGADSPAVANPVEHGDADVARPFSDLIVWTGVLVGSSSGHMSQIADYAQRHSVVPIDLSGVDRIDFVCAGALLNAINRAESQRKAVQLVGASPIIRALLLLIGISPRHFVKKPQ